MATSEAQRRANAKYNRQNMKSKTLSFSPREMDMWEHIQSKENGSGYIKSLIRADMEKDKA